MTIEISPTETGHALCQGEPLVFHCHHYNLALQNTIKQCAGFLDADQLQYSSGKSVVQTILSGSATIEQSFALFSQLGFGTIHAVSESEYRIDQSHYAVGYSTKYGVQADKPVCIFAASYIAASLAATGNLPAGSHVIEHQCVANGAECCKFSVTDVNGDQALLPRSQGAHISAAPIDLASANFGNIDVMNVLGALSQLPLIGNEEGLIPAFGVLLTRHFASYYNGLSYGLLDAMYRSGIDIGRELLIEAGHQCAFNTFGGIMTSPEWEGVVLPQIKNKEDWVYGITAVVNALGWGQWQVLDVQPDQSLTMRVTNGYETAGFQAQYHSHNDTTCFLAQGGVAGIMNLIYTGDIQSKPTLDQGFYDSIFNSGNQFLAQETKCMSRGDDCCEFVATKV